MIHLPIDFEMLNEFQLLVAELTTRQRKDAPACAPVVVAHYVWNKLYVQLAYLARRTNKPGVLTESGLTLLEHQLPMFGDDCRVQDVLSAAGVIEVREGGWFCPSFAAENKHLAGNFKRGVDIGAHKSAIVRQRQQVAREAQAQGMLLPPEIFTFGDGTRMSESVAQRSMVLIRTLDNCLDLARPRNKADYTQAMMAVAAAIVTKRTPEELLEFYTWVRANRGNALMPGSTEEILREFDRHYGASLEENA